MRAFIETLSMIKIEHSIFALPFTLAAAFLAASGLPQPRILALIILATVLARSAAMAFNRYLDADIDAQNPRTANRSIPAGRLTQNYALTFTLMNALLFVGVTLFINKLVALMAPIFLLVILGYSACKRFTSGSHLILGLALGLAPIGAWASVRGTLSWEPLVLALAVLSWVAGFDIIYACQDLEFDRQKGLFSIPARLGVAKALRVSRLLHLVTVAALFLLGRMLSLDVFYYAGAVAMAACLAYEHYLVWDGSLERVDQAFFTVNGMAGLAFGSLAITSVFI